MLKHVTPDDDDELDLEELKRRGLDVPAADEELYEQVVSRLRRELPEPPPVRMSSGITIPRIPQFDVTSFKPGFMHEIDMRRLDESIRDEQQLRAQLTATEKEVDRLEQDLDLFAQPVGVVSAVWILGLFSLLGIVAPLLAMAFGPKELPVGWSIALIASFVVGLAAVLIYIVWYLRKVTPDEASDVGR